MAAAAFRRAGGWRVAGPLILSLTLLLAILAFFTQFVHPFHQLYAARPSDSVGSLTIAGILIQTVLMMGVVLLALRHGRLPFGAMTAIIGVATGLQTVFHDLYVLLPAALLTGLIADLLAARLQPSETRRWQFFLFAATVPVVCYGLYFLTIQLAQGIAWTIHLWLGSIFLAGIAGLFVSFLVVSPLTRTTELANGSTQGDVSPSTRQVSQ